VPDGTVMMTTAVDNAAALGSDILAVRDIDRRVRLTVQNIEVAITTKNEICTKRTEMICVSTKRTTSHT
jgi:hypothetical protein